MARVETKYELVTPEMAREIINTHQFVRQRDLKKARVAELSSWIKLGKFYKNTTISLAECDGKLYLGDGQHRLHAVVETGSPQVFTVVRHYFDTYEDVKELYLTFDGGMRRSPFDRLRSIGADDMDVGELPRYMKTAAFNGSAFATGGCYVRNSGSTASNSAGDQIRRLFKDIETRLSIMRFWYPELRTIAEMFEGVPRVQRSFYSREGMVAVMLITLRYHHKQAVELWYDVISNEMPKEHPGQLLFAALIEKRDPIKNQMHMARAAAFVWNAYTTGRSVKILRTGDWNMPIYLHNTPHQADEHYVYIDRLGNLYTEPFGLDSLRLSYE